MALARLSEQLQFASSVNKSAAMLSHVLFGGFAALISSVSAQQNSSMVLVVNQKSFNVLRPVPPPSVNNLTTVG